jgi:hypothetical protein
LNESESEAHRPIARLKYLLMRLEGEFFHVHPDLGSNGRVTSLALSSILNEAVNLQEMAFPGTSFWDTVKEWGRVQTWGWNEVEVRFTWWPVCEILHPFQLLPPERLLIAGRDANNSVKHNGAFATLTDAVNACAAAWFLVLERGREAEIFLPASDIDHLMRFFDCYDFIDSRGASYGHVICRPLPSLVSYPIVRGPSEVESAEAAFRRRSSKWKR